ncbi:MAG: MoaD/ThiS family protein [Nitrososphaerales archaeon]
MSGEHVAMKVTVKYFAMIRDMTQKKQDVLDFGEETSVQTMLSRLCDMYGEEFKQSVCTAEGSLKEGLILLLNGEAVNREEFRTKMLKEGDMAAIMPPVGGG